MLLTMPHVPILVVRNINYQVSLLGQSSEMWENAQGKTPQIRSLATCNSLALHSNYTTYLPSSIILRMWERCHCSKRARLTPACLNGGDIHQRKPDPDSTTATNRSEVL